MTDRNRYPASQRRHAAVDGPPSGHNGYRPITTTSQERNRKKKKASGPWRAIFWLALIVFLGSLISLGVIAFSYLQGQNTYNDIASEAGLNPDDYAELPVDSLLGQMTVDWDALRAKNPDTVGWIYIPGTVVNYPIVQTTDDEKYLTTDFLGNEGWLANYGAIFMASHNAKDFSDPNNIIYGHHMNDGSMFACIDTFADQVNFDQHRTVYVLTPQGNYRLTTFGLVICGGDDPLAQANFVDEAERISYIQDKMNRSVVDPGSNAIPASEMGKTFALVTCDYTMDDGRAVLFASVVESTVPTENQEGQVVDPTVVNPDDVGAIEGAVEEIA